MVEIMTVEDIAGWVQGDDRKHDSEHECQLGEPFRGLTGSVGGAAVPDDGESARSVARAWWEDWRARAIA